MNLVLRTPRLTLRPLRIEDAPELNRIANQPHILRRMPDWQSSLEDTRQLITYLIPRYAEANRDTARVVFAVMLGGVMIGIVGIGNKEEAGNEIELAYFISEAYASKGYATEAARAASRWALETLQMDYLIAIVEPDNIPSQRVLEKCGFQKLETRMILNSGETEEKPYDYYRLYETFFFGTKEK